MLRELHVSNFALIDRVDLSFGDGLNILTGETGAGKSIIIDALGVVLGERASSADFVRTGSDRATVEALFDLDLAPPEVRDRLLAAGIEPEEDNLLIVTRELALGSGKSQCRINGRLVPVSVLREIGDGLVDVHGQHEHQSLLASDRHIDILDNWCGKDALSLRDDCAAKSAAVNALRRERDQLRADTRERARTLDLYRFQREEIATANLSVGEEEELAADRVRLASAEKLHAASSEAYAVLSGAENGGGSALDALNAALVSVEHAAALDERLGAIADSLRSAVSFAEDSAHELRVYQESVEFNPERLEEIESRLDLLRSLKRKYGETIAEIIAYSEQLTADMDRLEHAEAREDELAAAIARAEGDLESSAAQLTKIRTRGSEEFARSVLGELTDLGMAQTKFEVSITPQPAGPKGADRIEFLLSPNPGEPLRPLAKIASGGEMSRIMLAMKSILVRSGAVPTMIFDEIDVGVGGRTAQTIADKLDGLAQCAQILCITHLPQIASRADTHFLIDKKIVGDRTIVSVVSLGPDARVEEIARMLGGARRTDAVVQHAREMLECG